MIITYFSVFIFTFTQQILEFGNILYIFSIICVLVVAATHYIHTCYQILLIENRVFQVPVAWLAVQTKKS